MGGLGATDQKTREKRQETRERKEKNNTGKEIKQGKGNRNKENGIQDEKKWKLDQIKENNVSKEALIYYGQMVSWLNLALVLKLNKGTLVLNFGSWNWFSKIPW